MVMPATLSVGMQLLEFRRRFGLSQERMAVKIGVSHVTYSRWERDLFQPSKLGRIALAQLGFQTTEAVPRAN